MYCANVSHKISHNLDVDQHRSSPQMPTLHVGICISAHVKIAHKNHVKIITKKSIIISLYAWLFAEFVLNSTVVIKAYKNHVCKWILIGIKMAVFMWTKSFNLFPMLYCCKAEDVVHKSAAANITRLIERIEKQ